MKSIWSRTLPAVALAVIAGGVALLNIYPYRPRSTIGWCLLFVLALPLWLLFEYIGEQFTASRFLASLNPFPRIAIGVLIAGGFVVLILVVFSLVEPFLTKWGS